MRFSFILILLVVATLSGISQQTNHDSCSILKNGKFRYLDIPDTTAYFEINGEDHLEYHKSGLFFIKSKIKWLNNCSYETRLLEYTFPLFPYKKEDKMIVTVQKILGPVIYYSCEVRGEKWYGRLLKIN